MAFPGSDTDIGHKDKFFNFLLAKVLKIVFSSKRPINWTVENKNSRPGCHWSFLETERRLRFRRWHCKSRSKPSEAGPD